MNVTSSSKFEEPAAWGQAFCKLFGTTFPIVQGPMNGASPVELVAAVSNAGCLGSFAASLFDAETILGKVNQIRALTTKPFAVNLFITHAPDVSRAEIKSAVKRLRPAKSALGINSADVPNLIGEDFNSQLQAVLESAPPVASFTFGILPKTAIDRLHSKGILVIGTATTVSEAIAWESAGADCICMQGVEAGGHRGTFLGDFEQSGIGLMALIPQAREAVSVPLIAAGGIANGKGIAASLLLGADAAQLGTAFLVTPEAGVANQWRDAVLRTKSDSTRLTRCFSGRYARGIVNFFMDEMRAFESEFPPYPVQNALTADLRRKAVEIGDSRYMSLWAGQASPLARALPAKQLIQLLVAELGAAFCTHQPQHLAQFD